jgi:carboxylesterase
MERTDWTDWYGAAEAAFDALAAEVDAVAVCALSMGGSLALELAASRPVAALVLVNPSVGTTDKRFLVLPLLSKVMRSIPAIGNDIAKPGVEEGAYSRTPLKGVVALTRLWRTVRSHLAGVTAPVLLFRSHTDHVVDPSSAEIILRDVGSKQVQEVMLERSYHVATLDYDAPVIFEGCADFLAAHLR